MSFDPVQERRRARERARRARARRRLLAAASLTAVVVAAVVVVALAATGAGSSSSRGAAGPARAIATGGHRAAAGGRPLGGGARRGAAPAARSAGHPGDAAAPILMYHVINPPPPGAPYPGLYVPRSQFAAQMAALKAAGWHAVTMDQLWANWTRGAPLPPKPIVLSFDNGYASQYTNALPVLRRLGWVGVENIQLLGLPPAQGGLTDAQVRGLLAAGWELDTQGMSHAELTALGGAGLRYQIAHARALLRARYGVPVDWFCYPSGHYDAAVIAAVHAAGFVGSTTVVPGWARRALDPYRLPRLRVLGGTTPTELLGEIAAARDAPAPPPSYLPG
jgi:peptidoglycan/xylan/chitin deacetylase (PgdA/CDA1 family)